MLHRCSYCQNTEENVEIDRLFMDFDTSNNDSYNMIWACKNCIKAFKLKRAISAILALRKLGFITDNKAEWRYNNKLVRNELTNVQELKVINSQLEQQVHDLKNYISMLEQRGLTLPEIHGNITGN